MKKYISLFLLIFAAACLFGQTKGKVAAKNYSFSSQDLEGNPISSELYSNNKITMINVWGTFCGPCIREMPELAKLSEDNLKAGVQIIGIPIDLTDAKGNIIPSVRADADYIIKLTGVGYKNVVPTPDMLFGFLYDIQAVPTTIFVDKDGNMLGEPILGSRSYKDWQKIIKGLLKEVK